MWLLELCDY